MALCTFDRKWKNSICYLLFKTISKYLLLIRSMSICHSERSEESLPFVYIKRVG